ncbi:MAG: hypothetical protein ACRC8D_07255 [Aeromonas sp.]
MSSTKRIPIRVIHIATRREVEFPSIAAAAEEGGFDAAQIRHCLRGRRAQHCGHIFRYVDPSKRPTQETAPFILEVAELRNAGLSNVEIAEVRGCTPSTIAHYLSLATATGLCKSYHQTQRDIRARKAIDIASDLHRL